MTAVRLLHLANATGRVVQRILLLFEPLRVTAAAIGGVLVLKRHWRLALTMARRELSSRYAGQFMGSFWILGHPVLQMLVFVYLFAIVFQLKMAGNYEQPRDYTVYILTGLVAWLSILPVLTTGCLSITSNSALVKQFNFAIEVLPIKDVIITLVFWVVGTVIVAVYTLLEYRELPWTYILLPLLFAIHFTFLIGCAWMLSAVSVFFHDLKEIIQVWANLGLYLLPIAYLPEAAPKVFRPILYANPMSCIVWIHQDVLYFGRIEHPVSWFLSIIIALLAFTTGYRVFERLRPFFGGAM